jgi:flagella basal body P-ring formation protein FlgA
MILCLLPLPAFADAVVTNRVIKAGQVIEAQDISTVDADIPGAITDPARVAGLEARVALYPGRPIREDQVGPPAIVNRNQVVPLSYVTETMTISTSGRALDRGGVGDLIFVLNLSSRNRVQGTVMPDGSVRVGRIEG